MTIDNEAASKTKSTSPLNQPGAMPGATDEQAAALRQSIIAQLFQRYADLAAAHVDALAHLPLRCRGEAIISLCNEAIANGRSYPFDKMNRWLGFAQGVLAVQGIIDVDTERDFTRPLLHQLHAGPIKTWPPA